METPCSLHACGAYPCSASLLHTLATCPPCLGGAGCGGWVCQEADKQGEEDDDNGKEASEEESKVGDSETDPSDDDDDEDAVGWKVGGWDIARHGKGQPLRLSLWRVARRLAFPPSSGRRRTSPTGPAAAAAWTTSAVATPRMGGRESRDM